MAYDAQLFERAVALLVTLVTNEPPPEPSRAFEPVSTLFSILFSGTRASLSARLSVLDGLLSHIERLVRDVGVHALRAALQTSEFRHARHAPFGSRSRDFGLEPKSLSDVQHWFRTVLKLAERFAQAETEVASQVRAVVAQQFRELWNESGCSDELDRVAHGFASASFWREGWIAVMETRRSHEPDDAVEADRLCDLEQFLRPKTLADEVRGYVLCSDVDYYRLHDDDLEQDFLARRRRAEELGEQFVERLGREVARSVGVFDELLPELLVGATGVAVFARGYATETAMPKETWERMLEVLRPTANAHAGLMVGFLQGLHSRAPELAEDLLGDLLADPALTRWLPVLQSALPIDQRAVERLHKSLAGGATGKAFYHLAYGPLDTLPGDAFRRLVLAIG